MTISTPMRTHPWQAARKTIVYPIAVWLITALMVAWATHQLLAETDWAIWFFLFATVQALLFWQQARCRLPAEVLVTPQQHIYVRHYVMTRLTAQTKTLDFADIKAVVSYYQPTIWQDFGNIHTVLLLNQAGAMPIVFAVHTASKRNKGYWRQSLVADTQAAQQCRAKLSQLIQIQNKGFIGRCEFNDLLFTLKNGTHITENNDV